MARLIDADALIEDLEYDVELDARKLDDMDFVGGGRDNIQFDKDCKQNAIDLLLHAPTIEERKAEDVDSVLASIKTDCEQRINCDGCRFFSGGSAMCKIWGLPSNWAVEMKGGAE